MADDRPQEEEARAVELIETGSDVVGAVSGAAIGMLGGPIFSIGGAAAGVAVARAVRHVGGELRQRFLAPREQARVGGVLALAIVAIGEELKRGKAPRDDGFFEPRGNRSAASDELLEGVLLKARDAYEEKKLPLLANLYASFAFKVEISSAHASHLIELASRLTYRQLTVLGLTVDGRAKDRLRPTAYRTDAEKLKSLGVDGQALLVEIYELYQLGLVNDGKGAAWISVADVNPSGIRPQASGWVLAETMRLAQEIPAAEQDEVARILS